MQIGETQTPALPSDLASALLALMVESRSAETQASQGEIQHQAELVEQARRQITEALRRAAEAQDNAGFWAALGNFFSGDVAAIAGLVAALAVTVATGGTGAPALLAVTAAALSTASTIGRQCGLDPMACKVLGGVAAALGVLTGNIGAGAAACQTVATGARVVQAGATAVGGVAHAVEGQYQTDALDAQADAKAAQGLQQDAWFRMDLAIGILEQCARDLERGRKGAAEIQRTVFEGNAAVIGQIGAAS